MMARVRVWEAVQALGHELSLRSGTVTSASPDLLQVLIVPPLWSPRSSLRLSVCSVSASRSKDHVVKPPTTYPGTLVPLFVRTRPLWTASTFLSALGSFQFLLIELRARFAFYTTLLFL